MRRGSRLSPASLGLLASVGRPRVMVIPRPRVAIVSTGDELVPPEETPGPGQIRNSNAVMLQALAVSRGATVSALPIARDEPGELKRILKEGLDSDVLLITGGVSAGQRDLVPAALAELGVTRIFHKIRLKPGKPLWFGTLPGQGDRAGTLVFGLPGNPVSGLVGFLLFVGPALHQLSRPVRVVARAGRGQAWRHVHSPRRPADLSPGAVAGTTAGMRRRALSSRCRGPDRPICWRWPRPTASPFFPPVTGLSRQEKLSDSCRSTRMKESYPSPPRLPGRWPPLARRMGLQCEGCPTAVHSRAVEPACGDRARRTQASNGNRGARQK